MNQAEKISLISKEYTINSIGVPIAVETKKDVFAIVSSIGQTEFYQAGLIGLKPEAVYYVKSWEYSGQEEIEVKGERLDIYRTYVRADGRTELYVRKDKGHDIGTT